VTGRFAGVDIGGRGAASLIEAGRLVDCRDMPCLDDGPNARRTLNAPMLAALFRDLRPDAAFVELVTSRPTDGPVGAFSFGRARGMVEGILGAQGVPIFWLAVPRWRRLVGLPAGASKDMARSEAIRRWPAHASLFARVCDDGRAESALIALAGLLREGRS
jgi:crossover junction endodeoxyribonuclease RuvC